MRHDYFDILAIFMHSMPIVNDFLKRQFYVKVRVDRFEPQNGSQKAVIPAKLLLRNLYRCLVKKKSWNDKLIIDTATRTDLQWWQRSLTSWSGKSFSHDISEVCIIESDASKEGEE